MTEVFDSYAKRTLLYYALLIITIVTILFLITAWAVDLQVPRKYSAYLIILVSLGIFAIIANMFLSATDVVRMYIKNGELTISTEFVIINSIEIPISKVKKLVITANDYRGARSSDGSGNRIEVYDQSNMCYHCRFVINSKIQRENLSKILDQLHANGVTVNS